MHIRAAVKEDAPRIAKIHIEAWRSAYAGILPDDYLKSLSVKTRAQQWHSTLTKKNVGFNLVVEYQNLVSGFAVYGPTRDIDLKNQHVGELAALNISPDLWRLGLGAGLINEVIKLAHGEKWQSLYLWVIKENTRARSFYKSKGFEPDGLEKIDNELRGIDLHEIRYILNLN